MKLDSKGKIVLDSLESRVSMGSKGADHALLSKVCLESQQTEIKGSTSLFEFLSERKELNIQPSGGECRSIS